MERGRTFYITLVSGLVALVLLLVSVNLPAQLVFESKPYALAVLKSGKLDGWTADELGLSSSELEYVKNNYMEFLSRQKTADDSDESDSSDSDDSDEGTDVNPENGTNNVTYHTAEPGDNDNDDVNRRRKRADDDVDDDEDDDEEDNSNEKGQITAKNTSGDSSSSSSDSSDSDEGDSSESNELTLEQRLQDKPMTEHVGLGLFHGTVCSVMKNEKESCKSVSINEAIYALDHEVSFMQTDINMAMWNNLRVESLFSVITCVFGLVSLFAALRPCCESKRLPVYLGAISFFASGALVFIPIVRLLLVRTDLEQNIISDYNVTLKVQTSWSLVASGISIPFALLASFALIATKWYRVTKHWYHYLKAHPENHGIVQNGTAVELRKVEN